MEEEGRVRAWNTFEKGTQIGLQRCDEMGSDVASGRRKSREAGQPGSRLSGMGMWTGKWV